MQSRWNDADAKQCASPLELRVYTSRLLGQEPSLVLHGGGNTSVKTRLPDLMGREVDVLCVKGSGWDMAVIEPAGLPAVRLAELRMLRSRDALSDEPLLNPCEQGLFDEIGNRPSRQSGIRQQFSSAKSPCNNPHPPQPSALFLFRLQSRSSFRQLALLDQCVMPLNEVFAFFTQRFEFLLGRLGSGPVFGDRSSDNRPSWSFLSRHYRRVSSSIRGVLIRQPVHDAVVGGGFLGGCRSGRFLSGELKRNRTNSQDVARL